MQAGDLRRFYAPRRICDGSPVFENHALVAGAASDLVAVEVFKEGNGVLSRDARKRLETRNVDETIGFVLGSVVLQFYREVRNGLRVHEHVTLHAHELSVVEQ